MLVVAMAGPRRQRQWSEATVDLDFYDLKGVVEELLDRLNLKGARACRIAGQNPLHPGRTLAIEWKDLRLGVMGELHPGTARNFEFRVPVFLAELDLEALLQVDQDDSLHIAPPPRFPAVRRDLALVAEERVAVSELFDVIRETAGPLLSAVELFDLYRGRGLPAGTKSCGITLTFRSQERTLTDAEVAEIEVRIVEQLERLTGARLRR
jgi:phenylalanyl-tRNA synthetase beta chain